jgi:hypothetical protein
MSNYKTVAYLTLGHEYFEIFPDGEVPVVSFVPQHLDICPEPCLLLDGSRLSDEQVKLFAVLVMHRWPDLFCDSHDAEESVRQGFPMLSRHFDGGCSNDPNVMLAFLEYGSGFEDLFSSLEGDGGLGL